jgi:hypothetical protein
MMLSWVVGAVCAGVQVFAAVNGGLPEYQKYVSQIPKSTSEPSESAGGASEP